MGEEGSDHVKPCDSNWVNIEEAQLKISSYTLKVHRTLIKNWLNSRGDQ